MAFGGALGSALNDTSIYLKKKEGHHHHHTMTPLSMSRLCSPYPSSRQTQEQCAVASSAPSQATSTCSSASPMNSPDLERLSGTVAMLEASGWYYGQLSWQSAADKLKKTPVGTFLLRDSADSRYLFSLSVQTERGPTSVRIHYDKGQFQLDAEARLSETMPLFDCVVALVEHYVRLSGTPKASAHVWLDPIGRRDLTICLSEPLYHGVPTLQHMCRRTINSSVVPSMGLKGLDILPKTLVDYVREYPYGR